MGDKVQRSVLGGSLPAVISSRQKRDGARCKARLRKRALQNPRSKLTLRELEALALALRAVLLALLHTVVARQKTVLAHRSPHLRIQLPEPPRHSPPHLTAFPTAPAPTRPPTTLPLA